MVDVHSLELFDMQAIDFLDKLLRYDHQDRLTAREAMVKSSAIFCCYISLSCLTSNMDCVAHFLSLLSFLFSLIWKKLTSCGECKYRRQMHAKDGMASITLSHVLSGYTLG